MPRQARFALGGVIYHALNRGVGRATLFDKPADYEAFEDILALGNQGSMYIYASETLHYCLSKIQPSPGLFSLLRFAYGDLGGRGV